VPVGWWLWELGESCGKTLVGGSCVPFFFTFIFNLVPLLLFIQPNFNGMEGRMSGMEARIWLSEKNKEEPHTNSSFYSSFFCCCVKMKENKARASFFRLSLFFSFKTQQEERNDE